MASAFLITYCQIMTHTVVSSFRDSVCRSYCFQEGEELIGQQHFASSSIKEELDYLNRSWHQLEEASHDKRDRLQEAYQVRAMLGWGVGCWVVGYWVEGEGSVV